MALVHVYPVSGTFFPVNANLTEVRASRQAFRDYFRALPITFV
jgi:hypothetical protein